MSAHTIIIVRHGKATGNNPDAPLTAMGKQAQQEAFFLQQLLSNEKALIVTSPYARAVQTAEEISSILELPLLLDDKQLIERELGNITSLTDEELWCQLQSHFEQPELSFPHGESNAKVT
ncbi:histidine phosphatase family protein [Bacillus pumilus]|uniref:histidine phosphatase family protein n=1 Tax=Bacillus pumilus TaxID=1408 RepID=UPI0034530873